MCENNIIEFNTDSLKPARTADSLKENRRAFADVNKNNCVEVSIIVQAYNRLEKTKKCVDSILKYTSGVDYELILIDNGSSDGTLDYFQSVPLDNKTIYHITKNLGSGYPKQLLNYTQMGRFICTIDNDIILTERWLDNLLICIKSDDNIGMVTPMSSNVSNLQEVNLEYSNDTEMQRTAAIFNNSDSREWQDRLRLITIGTLYRKEALYAIGWPLTDPGFAHDFSDDDIAFRIRRAGYRVVLVGDTWVCHNHDVYH